MDGVGRAARFNTPRGIAVDGGGTVYVADTFNHAIRTIAPDGTVRTLAGLAGVTGDADGIGNAARFFAPAAVAVDGGGAVYVADSGNQIIGRILGGGVVTTLAGTSGAFGSADGSGQRRPFLRS